ncbi:hypothetical protein [Halorubrum salipaludis]|uniref:hypothetical protein n=1 Tax=Halorubrum salipaludis TaxID=2032630 RepID=UPI00118191EB|nr:hypothetical protein [Halorubrum salipaludis]
MAGEERPKWIPYSSKKEDDRPEASDISYADASNYQKTEFGPIPSQNSSSARTQRLNSREGYSPTEADKPRFAGALASSLSLSKAHTSEVYSIMSSLNLAAFGNQRDIETVALGVIVVVVNYDRFYRQQNPEADRISESREFRKLMKDLNIDYSDIGTAKRIVKQELKEQDYF